MMVDATDNSHSCLSGPGYGPRSKASTRKAVAASPEPHKKVLPGLGVMLTLGDPKRGSAVSREAGPVHKSLSSHCHCRANSAFTPGFVSSMHMEDLITLGAERSVSAGATLMDMSSALRK